MIIEGTLEDGRRVIRGHGGITIEPAKQNSNVSIWLNKDEAASVIAALETMVLQHKDKTARGMETIRKNWTDVAARIKWSIERR